MSLKKAPAKTFDDIIRECESEENSRELPHFVSLKDFLSMELPPREFVVEPILPTQGLMMIYAKRGVGKTFFALHIACSIARQTNLFNDKWKIDQARKVLYIDGEMPANTMQERLKVLNHSHKIEHDNLIIINNDLRKDDLQRSPAPNLATEEGQNKIEALIDEQRVEVIVIDNLSTLCRGGKENESDSWLPIQEWILRLRSKNKSVILVHHAGKNNEQIVQQNLVSPPIFHNPYSPNLSPKIWLICAKFPANLGIGFRHFPCVRLSKIILVLTASSRSEWK